MGAALPGARNARLVAGPLWTRRGNYVAFGIRLVGQDRRLDADRCRLHGRRADAGNHSENRTD